MDEQTRPPWYAGIISQVLGSWWFGAGACVALLVWVIERGHDHRLLAFFRPVTELVKAVIPGL